MEKNAAFTIFFTIPLQLMLSSRLLLMAKTNYSDIFKQKTKGNLKPRICCKKYYEYCTSKKKE